MQKDNASEKIYFLNILDIKFKFLISWIELT